jgi:acyl-lipid omega-6 desaturase (Delta-12 desaturase)
LSTTAVSGNGADWRRAVEPYVGPDARRASFQLVVTIGLLALAMTASHIALQTSLALALLMVLPIAGLLVRTFILMHDCAHGSFFETRALNDTVGFITGTLTFTPFAQWRRDHALHHASSGDLDRRGHGDVPTLTVREYLAKTPRQRLIYRIIRHPLALLMGGPFHLAFGQRFRGKSKATGSMQVSSVMATNLALLGGLTIAVMTVGWATLFVSYLLPYYVAAVAGIWLFYVQHQFEDAYWAPHADWDYVDASLRGSSQLQLPKPLNWFTGDIGLHHVHHVAPRIPNYRLRECHQRNELFHHAPIVTIRSGTAALRLALWDEESQRLVRFKDVHLS